MGANLIDCSQCSLPELKDWLRKNTKKVLNLGTHQTLTCDSPVAVKGQNVFDSYFYLTTCEAHKKFVISISVPIVFIMTIVTLCALMVLRYRFELAYIMFLFKQRNSSAVDMYEVSIYDAFICYSGSDRRFVLKTLMPLIENGKERYRLCLHDRDFLLGTHITRNIVHAIDKSRRTVIVLSNAFLKSRWCRWEVDMANNRLLEESRNFLVLIELEPLDHSKIPRHVKMLMATRTYLEWPRDNNERTLQHVRKRLTKALGKSIFQVTHRIKEVDEADILL
ncbi:toll-like receptor 2 type-2 [Anabrus simplex]|uniref:toll-like receptor 2 type-2 n=1 Tax=Anabrus simplex TaxID=316456 RepID=UPI0035A37E0B